MTVRERHVPSGVALIAVLALTASPAAAQYMEPDPQSQPDDTWISISGTVESVTPNTFRLDYGEGTIVVEMDDGDRDADAYQLAVGDQVTVNGVIDDDFFEARTIEASSVYVEKLDTYFFASAADEEGGIFSAPAPVLPANTEILGVVTAIEGNDFTLDTGRRQLTVDVAALGYDPLDDEGYLNIAVGDRVRVTGTFVDEFFEGRQFSARTLTELR